MEEESKDAVRIHVEVGNKVMFLKIILLPQEKSEVGRAHLEVKNGF